MDKEGGAQRLLYDICRHLPKNEFNLTVYYMFGEGGYEPELLSEGVSVVDLDADSNYDISAFIDFVKILREEKPDIIHTNSSISGVWGRMASTFVTAEVVSVEHSVHHEYRRIPRFVNGVTLPLANEIVGVSEAVIDSISSWENILIPADREQTTVYNGVDIKSIEKSLSKSHEIFSNHPDLDKHSQIVGSFGRLTKAKGYQYLIDSFEMIRENIDDVQLLIIGDGDERPMLENKAEQTGYIDDIFFTGHIKELYPILPDMTLTVFPSLWEGFGLTPVEAMAAKRPIIASDIPPFREVINESGILVKTEDPKSIAEATIKLLENSEYRNNLAKQGYQRATNKFNIDRTVEEYADIYRKLACD